MSAELDIKNAVEAAFGPGAFKLISDEHDQGAGVHEPATLSEDIVPDVVEQTARQTDTLQAAWGPDQQLVFEVSDGCFAVPTANVVEVQRLPEVTWMPRVPEWLRGVTSLRGRVISVCDLAMLLDLSSVPAEGSQLMVVVKTLADSINTALIVDRVSGIRDIGTKSTVESLLEGTAATFVRATFACDDRSVFLVDLERLLLSNKMRHLQS